MHSSGPLKKKKTEKMVLTEEGFQAFVEKLSECGGLKCKFCGQIFAVTTSISRFKWHWSGVEGRGVKVCAQVPSDIQEAAFLAMLQPPNKKHKTIEPSTSNAIGAISTSTQGQVNQVSNLVGGLERMELEQEAVGEERASPQAHDHMENMTEGMSKEIRRDALQAPDEVGQVDIENKDWAAIASIAQLMEVDVENVSGGFVASVHGASSSASLPCKISHQTRGHALPNCSSKLVGEAFEKNKNVIWSWLRNDQVSLIGIYGMGGVGKTSLMKLIYNQLRSNSDTSCDVYWISVSQDCSINKLQMSIAEQLSVIFSNADDEFQRAQKLSETLVVKEQFILVLDDMWNFFDLETVGIPIQKKGCKLIFTTRSLKICREMGCLQHNIKVEPLSEEEAWALFMEKLMHDDVLSPRVEPIAKSVAKECAGLPLAIITLARSMRGVDKTYEWRNTLMKLEESEARDMEDKVFKLLRFSYDCLNGLALQQCFLYCALFAEDYVIGRSELIGYLIDEGIIRRMKSRQAEFDEGHTMLDRLENVCLLERCNDGSAVKMHDLLRDMALQIQRENSLVMVKAGGNLTELPELEEWNEDLVRVSLMNNKIHEIPQNHSPRCPNLSTLLLCHNIKLQYIADSFFQQFRRLKVLDLSGTDISILPDSISDLVTLNGLLLRNCYSLHNLPPLKNLKALRRLDLKNTKLKNFPEDMEWLSNLRYLRVDGCGHKGFPTGILPKLPHLQVFIQGFTPSWVHGDFAQVAWVEGNEVACLRKLEILQCHFEHLSDLVEYLKSRDKAQSLNSYGLYVGRWDPYDDDNLQDYGCISKTIGLRDLIISKDRDFQVMFPSDIKRLMLHKCHDVTSLCDISSSIKNATELEVIDIRACNRMESLLPSHGGLFSHLKNLICFACRNMKKLFPPALLPNLVNLELIRVEFCANLEEIIAKKDQMGDMEEECSSYSTTEFCLPKLRYLKLNCLPELKSICSAKLKCISLEEIEVDKCPKLETVPISFPLVDSGRPYPSSLRESIMSMESGSQWSETTDLESIPYDPY